MKSDILFITTPTFDKAYKRLRKRYASLPDDLFRLRDELSVNQEIGISLGGGFRKIRLAIKSKGRGKSGGVRVISLHLLSDATNKQIIFSLIYDKSEYPSVSEQQIRDSIKGIEP
jgi:mRNA-degrading endonuclease RelE of RelBE toxin-antitoxin system